MNLEIENKLHAFNHRLSRLGSKTGLNKLVNHAYGLLFLTVFLGSNVVVLAYGLREGGQYLNLIGLYFLSTGLLLSFIFLKARKSIKIGRRIWQSGKPEDTLHDREKQMRSRLEEDTLASFSMDLQPAGNEESLLDHLMIRIAKKFDAVQGLYYEKKDGLLHLRATYAFFRDKEIYETIPVDEGFFGVVDRKKKFLVIENVPDGYLEPFSGLGQSKPAFLLFVPVVKDGEMTGLFELATFKRPGVEARVIADHITQYLSVILEGKEKNLLVHSN